MLTRRKVLGLAVASGSLTVVEVDGGSVRPRAIRAAEFAFPEGPGLDEPAQLGKSLKEFLRQQGFSPTGCVIGMEARWLTSRQKSLPPGAGDAVADILRLMVEREFASDSRELLTDYAGPQGTGPGRSDPGRVVLFAGARRHIDRLVQTVQAAGLKALAVTSSTAALSKGLCESGAVGDSLPITSGRRGFVLNLSPDGVEVAILSPDSPPDLRRLSVAMPAEQDSDARRKFLEHLTAELRRIVSLLPDDGEPGPGAPGPELIIPAAAGLDAAEAEDLAGRLSLSVRMIALPVGLDWMPPAGPDAGKYAAAASLGMAGLPGGNLVFDLLHSRLTPARKKTLGRKAFWAGGAVAAALAAFILLLLAWQSNLREVRDMETQLAGMSDSLRQAGEIVEKTSLARRWYLRRPRFLECMRELTLAFPAEGRIWTTSLAVEEDMRVVFSGKAVSEAAVLEVLDHLKASPRFADVKPLYLRESGRSQREVTFAMSCRFVEGS